MTLYDPAPAEALLARHHLAADPFECSFGEARLSIPHGVFCPVFTKTSPILLDCIDFKPEDRVLDVFSGSGAFGLVAAITGAKTVAIDKSPAAIACIRANAALNGVADRLEARAGDLAQHAGSGLLPTERFDLIIANPPLLPGTPDGLLAAALLDPDLGATRVFIELLPAHLAEGGRAYLLTSDVLERMGHRVEAMCETQGLEATLQTSRDFGYETYRVHRITRRAGAAC
jgi:methylase of polypeptide subunit release factors